MVDIPDVGHTVKIEVQGHNGNTNHECIILHPAAKDHITIKLPNGYNASYPIEAIISVEVTGKVAEVDGSEVNEVTMNESLPRVRIIHTGGTIASKVDYKTGAVIAKFEPAEIVASIPELASIANIDAEKMGNMFSDDIRPQHWNEIAQATKRAFDDGCYGVVITHGTDTILKTANYLSTITKKTIVLTGAFLPYAFKNSDTEIKFYSLHNLKYEPDEVKLAIVKDYYQYVN